MYQDVEWLGDDCDPQELDDDFVAWRVRVIQSLPGRRTSANVATADTGLGEGAIRLLEWAASATAGGVLGNAASDWAKRSRAVKALRRDQRRSQQQRFVSAACMALERAAKANGMSLPRDPYQFGTWSKTYRRDRLFWSSKVTLGDNGSPYAVIFIPHENLAAEHVHVDFS